MRQPAVQPHLRVHCRQGRLGRRGVGRPHQEVQHLRHELAERHGGDWIGLLKIDLASKKTLPPWTLHVRSTVFEFSECMLKGMKSSNNGCFGETGASDHCVGRVLPFTYTITHGCRPPVELLQHPAAGMNPLSGKTFVKSESKAKQSTYSARKIILH